jgi:transcription elongation GreA/GreB family factor
MSRAFVREPDGDQVADDLPELPQEPIPNRVTPQGLSDLNTRLAELEKERDRLAETDDLVERSKLAHVERDLRYIEGRIYHAELVEPAEQPQDRVAFGAAVEVGDEDGTKHTYRIVGEDEADFDAGKVSWVSPLARALEGAVVGDVVTWKRPAGDLDLEVLAISYPE